jgi:spore coat polysaccharide biosynthesis protein SpsF
LDFERISDLAAPFGIQVIAGPEDDVLTRYVLAAERMRPDIIVRCTADNPLVFQEGIRLALDRFDPGKEDYLVMDSLPLGAGFELLATTALVRASREARDAYEREHVTPYIYRHPELFRLSSIPAPCEVSSPGLRVTVDTPRDYERMSEWYAKYMDQSTGIVDLAEVVKNESS